MKLRDHYDWVVLGDHPGALLERGLAARLGLSVLMLPVFPGKSLSIAEDGRFVDPEPNYLLGIGPGASLQRAALGVPEPAGDPARRARADPGTRSRCPRCMTPGSSDWISARMTRAAGA